MVGGRCPLDNVTILHKNSILCIFSRSLPRVENCQLFQAHSGPFILNSPYFNHNQNELFNNRRKNSISRKFATKMTLFSHISLKLVNSSTVSCCSDEFSCTISSTMYCTVNQVKFIIHSDLLWTSWIFNVLQVFEDTNAGAIEVNEEELSIVIYFV